MSRKHPSLEGNAPDAPADVRPLPARPNLEFERKQAKQLLRHLRSADPEAIARVQAKLRQSAETRPDEFQLSDAQFTIAREYGFTSWPRLVEYFDMLARHEISGARDRHEPTSHHESWARTIVAEHRDKRRWTEQVLTAYVPRFHGRTAEAVFASEVTLDEARLATARMHRYPSWDVMLAESTPRDAWKEHATPLARALRAMRAGDLDALSALVTDHPELLSPAEQGHPRSDTLARSVLLFDLKAATPESRRVYEWLQDRIDLTETLNWMQLGYMRMTRQEMQHLLDRGADPAWVAPNGYSVLEHVIWRCWNSEVVDLVASRVTPREAFWIAAGLGDVNRITQYVDDRGVPTARARANRPDFTALGPVPMPPQNPVPDDESLIWEAFLVAIFNQRFPVLDALLDRGFPIDYMGWGSTALHLAVGNGWLPVVEYLVRRGADVTVRGWRPHLSARESAEEHFLNPHRHANAERILELVGGRDPETLRRVRDERRATRVMGTAPSVEQVFEFARQDAVVAGRSAVDQESLFIGLLRFGRLPVAILAGAGVDLDRLHSALRERMHPTPVEVPAGMTADPDVSAILLDARTLAEERQEDLLGSHHVLQALIRRASVSVVKIIESAGGTRDKLLASIERFLP